MRNEALGSKKMGKLVIGISIPMMASLLVQALYNIVDSMFISRVSEKTLTAVSMAFPVQLVMISFAVGLAVGANSLLSRCQGAGDSEKTSRAASAGLAIAVGATADKEMKH